MLIDFLRGNNHDVFTLILNFLVRIFVVFCILPIHEFAHAWTAHKLGDDTAKNQGRLTLAPMAHVDWIGALMLLLCGFGYAKPVPVNSRNFRRKNKDSNIYDFRDFDAGYAKRCTALVSMAGPLSNLIVAFLSMIVYYLIRVFAPQTTFTYILYMIFNYTAVINVNLAIFNLIPIPPLDGSKILNAVLPNQIYFKIMQYERYIMIALIILLFTGVLSYPLQWLSGKTLEGMSYIILLPMRLLGLIA